MASNGYALQQAQLELEVKETDLDVLNRYSKAKKLQELEGILKAKEAKLASDQAAVALEKSKLEREQQQLEYCVIQAQGGGMVVYAGSQQWENKPDIREGATVREDQILLLMPDLDNMQVKVGSQITVSVNSMDQVDETAAAIETLLEQYHAKPHYAVVVPKELLRQAERTWAMFNVLLVVIAGISLLVGGIGIMNIMLATVTERTREIGIRRALGATRQHIVQQFLTETVVLSAGGGLLGVLFGLFCGPLFHALRSGLTLLKSDLLPPIVHNLEPRTAPWSVALSLVISLGVGIVFGVYPARKAAYMDPVEALRHE